MASRLALRWVAKPLHQVRCSVSGTTSCLVLGPLRSPTQGKPARHNKPACLPQVVSRLVQVPTPILLAHFAHELAVFGALHRQVHAKELTAEGVAGPT